MIERGSRERCIPELISYWTGTVPWTKRGLQMNQMNKHVLERKESSKEYKNLGPKIGDIT